MKTPKKTTYSLLIALAFIVIGLSGCTTDRPMVRIEKGYTLSDYHMFEVEEAENGTDIPLPENILKEVKKRLEARLVEKGLILNKNSDEKNGVIVLRDTLISYDITASLGLAIVPGSKNECIIQVELIDKKTNRVLGDFVARGTTMGGGLIALSLEPEIKIIDSAAKSIAKEIARQMGSK